jgi:hypothetical protein
MNKYIFLFIFILNFLVGSLLYGAASDEYGSDSFRMSQQDTLQAKQILYTGKVWRKYFNRIEGDQFLFSSDLLPGVVTISGKSFGNINIRYDIYNDEILTPVNNWAFLQINKEKVDSFNFFFHNKVFHFANIRQDSLEGIKGYVNVLYKGETSLYVKYKKEIDHFAVENKFDKFYETHIIYLVKDNIAYPITGKRDLLRISGEYQVQIKNFIKKSKLKISKKKPESFIPVVAFYESIYR